MRVALFRRMLKTRTLLRSALLIGVAMTSVATSKPPSGKPKIDPQADKVLHEMSTYLMGLKSFQVESEATDGVVLKNGSKIQMVTDSRVTVKRPNMLKSEQIGKSAKMMGWYDGKNLSVLCRSQNTYGTVKAPPTIDAMLDEARKKYGVDAPAADLLYANTYDVLTENATAGYYIGVEDIDGVPAHHLLFQEDDVDWQVWVQTGTEPLPLRFVITTKTMKQWPEFTAQLKNWKTQVNAADSEFAFKPPVEAKRVATLPDSCPATP